METMSELLPVGTLVRVHTSICKSVSEFVLIDAEPLWVVTHRPQDDSPRGVYMCRSLTTGRRHVWFRSELVTADDVREQPYE